MNEILFSRILFHFFYTYKNSSDFLKIHKSDFFFNFLLLSQNKFDLLQIKNHFF